MRLHWRGAGEKKVIEVLLLIRSPLKSMNSSPTFSN